MTVLSNTFPKGAIPAINTAFELDGPVVIPHFYNGHDKTFFEMQFERYAQNTPLSGVDSVPALSPGSTTQTAAQTGNFSGDYYWNGTQTSRSRSTIRRLRLPPAGAIAARRFGSGVPGTPTFNQIPTVA